MVMKLRIGSKLANTITVGNPRDDDICLWKSIDSR